MVIEALDQSLIAQIRSSSAIDSVTQCVTELALNSLDAKATSIAIRVNLTTFRIQVVDNGRGISRQNLESVGIRYMTSKCHTLEDLKKHLKYYGFKGEALANISKVSQRVTITTRERNCDETFVKISEKNEIRIDSANSRPSFGTTVTVEGFLNNLPVRQQCVKNNELENIKRSIESLIIIHPRVSFTLRNDLGAKLILLSVKCQDIASSFKTIHPEIDENEFALLKVRKNKIIVEGLIHKDFHENKRLQYVYVNKRPINCPKVQNLINSIFRKCVKGDQKKKVAVFVIHIKCPYSDVDINLEPTKTVVFFKKFDIVKRCIEKMVVTFLGGDSAQVIGKKSGPKGVESEFGVSQIGGAVKGFGAKRKFEELEEISNKSEKIIEATPFFEEVKIPTKQAKVALPIEIKKNEKKEIEAASDVVDKSIFTNFPENEKRGKDLIMDMFIMSLKVFPAEEQENTKDGNLESLGQNDSKELTPSSLRLPNKVNLGVQTTFSEVFPCREKMVSVGVQTGFGLADPIFDGDISLFPRKSMKKFVSDYDFDFSRVDTFPVFNFKSKPETEFPFFDKLNQTKKLFDFRNSRVKSCNIFGNQIQPKIYFDDNFDQDVRPDSRVVESHPKNEDFPKLQKPVQESPYFAKKPLTRNILPLSQKNRNCICGNESETFKNNLTDNFDNNVTSTSKNVNKVEMTFVKKPKAKKRLNESSISKYFTPKKVKRFPKINSLSQNKNSQKPKVVNTSFDESKDLCNLSKLSQNDLEDIQSNLIITIDDEDKDEIINRDRNFEQKFSEDFLAPTLTQKFDTNIYPSNQPSKKDLSFEIMERFDFVPKGLSPILKDYGKVDDLSPESKEQLQNALIQSYDDELLFVKWQNYIDNKDPKKFFEEIYLERSKLIEGSIPNINKTGYAKHIKGFEHLSFTKKLFKNLEVVGQVDRKFIATIDKSKNLLLLFDQHAVHERVRLEELSESYKSTSIRLEQNITIFLPHGDLHLLKYQKDNLKSLGLVLDFFTNGITIFEVPLCMYNKSRKGVDIISLTEALIKQIIETLKTNNGIIVNTPKIIQNIVNSEACRGAIKFGDLLSKNECIMHLKKLLGCNLPFQCAHGRPTVTPLLFLNKLYDPFWAKPNLNNLK